MRIHTVAFVHCLLFAFQAAAAVSREGACEADAPRGHSEEKAAHALLQTARRSSQSGAALQATDEKKQDPQVATPGIASQLLPPDLLQLGIQILGSEQNLDTFVWNTRLEQVTYAGIPVNLRMVNGDLSDGTMNEEGKSGGLYGLEGLEEVRMRPPAQNGINMVDLGGNYGVVSIAAWKKYPTLVRSVMVEPISTTYFLLRWNMYLNGVPAIEEAQLQFAQADPPTGLLVLNKGVVGTSGETLEFCYTPPYTMNAFKCKCEEWPSHQCSHVEGITMKNLVDLFGSSPITLAKVDCEGCEVVSLPDVHKIVTEQPDRIRRLVGELHNPTRDIEDIACLFDAGQFFVRLCSTAVSSVEPLPLSCAQPIVPCLGGDGFPNYQAPALPAVPLPADGTALLAKSSQTSGSNASVASTPAVNKTKAAVDAAAMAAVLAKQLANEAAALAATGA